MSTLHHEIDLYLDDHVRLRMFIWPEEQHRWIFSRRYVEREEGGFDTVVVNDVKLVVNYKDGRLDRDPISVGDTATVVLSMHVIVPARLGKRFLAGLDISPGAKTYVEFWYRLDTAALVLAEIRVGAFKRYVLNRTSAALVQPIVTTQPILDRIKLDCGEYRVPYLREDGTHGHFAFPCSTLQYDECASREEEVDP